MTPEPGKFYLATDAGGCDPTPFIVTNESARGDLAPGLTVWGFSVYHGSADYRTIGRRFRDWISPAMVITEDRDRRLDKCPRPAGIPVLVEEAARAAEVLRKAEDAIAAAVVAAVSAEVPGPWFGAQREASIEAGGATVGVAWSEEGWFAYATGPRVVGEYVEGLPASSPSLALAALERRLHRGSKPWRVAACSLVVWLRRGWL